MTPERYEALVTAVLASGPIPAGCEVARRKVYVGLSGQRYALDIAVEVPFAGTRIVVAIECKCETRPVGVDEVLEFCAKLLDIGAHKGIVVGVRVSTGSVHGRCRTRHRAGARPRPSPVVRRATRKRHQLRRLTVRVRGGACRRRKGGGDHH